MAEWAETFFKTYADVDPALRSKVRGASTRQIEILQGACGEKLPQDYVEYLQYFGVNDADVIGHLNGLPRVDFHESYNIDSQIQAYTVDYLKWLAERPEAGWIGVFSHYMDGFSLYLDAKTGVVSLSDEKEIYFADTWSELFLQLAFEKYRVTFGKYLIYEQGVDGDKGLVDADYRDERNCNFAALSAKWGLEYVGLDDRAKSYRELGERVHLKLLNFIGPTTLTIGGPDMRLARQIGKDWATLTGAEFNPDLSKPRSWTWRGLIWGEENT